MFKNRIAYDEVSPFTKNLCVLVDTDDSSGFPIVSKLCMESGFTTNNLMINPEEVLPSLEKNYLVGHYFARIDDSGHVWIPSAQSTDVAALYPLKVEDASVEGGFILQWQVCPLYVWYEEGQEDPQVSMQFENAQNFAQDQFPAAFELFMSMSNTLSSEKQ